MTGSPTLPSLTVHPRTNRGIQGYAKLIVLTPPPRSLTEDSTSTGPTDCEHRRPWEHGLYGAPLGPLRRTAGTIGPITWVV